MKTMMKYTFLFLLLGLIASCTTESELYNGPSNAGSLEEGIRITLSFPDMQKAGSRAMNEQVQLNDLDLFLFVFDGNDLKQTIKISSDDTSWSQNNGAANNHRVSFTAYLPQTDNDATIHFVAINDSDGKFSEQINRVGYGLEDVVMTSFVTTGDQDAYWQRVELGVPITVSVDNTDNSLESVKGTEVEIKNIFSKTIPLIRNFAKVTVRSTANNFEVKAWALLNDLDGGYVVPWASPSGSPDVSYPIYVDENGKGKNYDDLNDEITGQGYHGVSLATAEFKNTVSSLDDYSDGDPMWNVSKISSRCLYERKWSSVNPIYVIVYGTYTGINGVKADGYYKLSVSKRDDETGLVTEYNILRNIEYTITITAASAPGYATAAEAAAGPSFNNISNDVTTKNMTQISDGTDMLFVNFINKVITTNAQAKEVDFRYRYLTGINNGSGTPANRLVIYDKEGIGIETGEVIKNFQVLGADNEVTEGGAKWRQILIETYEPSDMLRQQKFTIYSPPVDGEDGTLGLSRTINLVLRNPWDFIDMQVYPGHWTDDSKFPDYDPDRTPSNPEDEGNYYVGQEIGAPLTVFFRLPAGLPEALFPMSFVLESNTQNIENAASGNAVVHSDESLFRDQGVLDQRVQWIKTISWSDYAPNGEVSTAASRVIRARFSTTTNINNLTDDAITSTIRLKNEYFNMAEDKFRRRAGVDVSIPRSPAVVGSYYGWNFSNPEFSQLLNEINNGKFSRGNTKSIAGLTIKQNNAVGNNNRIKSGVTADGQSYIVLKNSGDQISFSMDYPEHDAATTAVLKVTASDDTANTNYTINFGESHTPNTVSVSASDNTAFNNNYDNPRTRTYTYTIPKEETILTITLKPSGDYNNDNANRIDGLRIYNIEFYPMGKEAANEN